MTEATSTTSPKTKSQDVRVDNWGNYLFQKLPLMFQRGELSDLTLQFGNMQVLKVHRVVLNLCTDYFTKYESLYGLNTDGSLQLPKELNFELVSTIIRFIYTGVLGIRPDQFSDVYRTAKQINFSFLTQLLETQSRKPILQDNQESNHTIVMENRVTVPAQQTSGIPVLKTVMKTPARKTTPGTRIRTKTILARVQTQAQAKRLQQTKVKAQHVFTQSIKTENHGRARWAYKEEPPRPTRFEWPEPESDTQTLSSNLLTTTQTFMENHNKSAPLALPPSASTKEIFDAVRTQVIVADPIAVETTAEIPENSVEILQSCDESGASTMIQAEHELMPIPIVSEDQEDVQNGIEPILMEGLMEEVVATSGYQVVHVDITNLEPTWSTEGIQGNIPIEVTSVTEVPLTEGLEIMELTSSEYVLSGTDTFEHEEEIPEEIPGDGAKSDPPLDHVVV